MDQFLALDHFEQVFAIVVWVVSSARITRLVVFDHYPPVVWLRITWDKYTGDSGWNMLLHCGYCFGFWTALAVGAWGWISGLDTIWWAANGLLAAAYASAYVVAYDGDD